VLDIEPPIPVVELLVPVDVFVELPPVLLPPVPFVEAPPVLLLHAPTAVPAATVRPRRMAPAVRWMDPSPARSGAPQLGQRVSRAKAWREHEGQATSTVPIPMRSWSRMNGVRVNLLAWRGGVL
jgi:hypothetical protein